jgi:PD-(D/E)XK nuclease superfamily
MGCVILALYYNCAIGKGVGNMDNTDLGKLNRRGAESAEVRELSYGVIGAAMEVHRILGAGFLESVYADALAIELEYRQIKFEREVEVSVNYKGRKVGTWNIVRLNLNERWKFLSIIKVEKLAQEEWIWL